MSSDRIAAVVLLSVGCLAVFAPWSTVGPFTVSGAQVGGGLGLVSILAYGATIAMLAAGKASFWSMWVPLPGISVPLWYVWAITQQMAESAERLEGNPFAGLAQVQLGFGATVCSAAGCLAMLVLYIGMFLRARKTGNIS